MIKEVILTVQPTNSNWRLGLNKNDSLSFFKHREEIKFILPNFNAFCAKTACGTSSKKAYDFNGKSSINKWIVQNKYHKYSFGLPTKLIFKLIIEKDKKILKFIKKKPAHNTRYKQFGY